MRLLLCGLLWVGLGALGTVDEVVGLEVLADKAGVVGGDELEEVAGAVSPSAVGGIEDVVVKIEDVADSISTKDDVASLKDVACVLKLASANRGEFFLSLYSSDRGIEDEPTSLSKQ